MLGLEQTELIFGQALHVDLPVVFVLIQFVCESVLLLPHEVLNLVNAKIRSRLKFNNPLLLAIINHHVDVLVADHT